MFNNLHAHQGGYPNPTVVAKFANPTTDFSTLLTTTSMPSGGLITRSGNAMLYDSTGKLTYAPNNLFLQSQTFTNASWLKIGATVTATGGIAPDGSATASRLQLASGASYLYQGVQPVGPISLISFYVMSNTGSNQTFRIFGNGTGTLGPNLTATTSWQRFSFVVTSTGGTSCGLTTDSATSACDLLIWGAQLEAVTYQTTPSTYVATTTAAYYGPRFDYDPATLQPKGLLVEGARTNISVYTEDFSNWTKAAGTETVTTNSVVSPSGAQNANTISRSGTTWWHGLRQSRVVSASTVYTFSVYCKPNTGDPGIVLSASTVVDFGIKLNGGSPSVISDTGSNKVISYGAIAVGNGWYRLWASFNTGSQTTVSPGTADGSSVSNASNYFFGAQLEAGSFPSSYIPCPSTSSVTRAAETFTISGYTNRLVEAYWIDQETGVSSSFPETVVTSGDTTINPPTFGWVTSLRTYTNAYAGDIATPSWIDNSGTTGNRMYTDSTGTLTWAPANLLTYSQDFGATGWPATYQVTPTGSQPGAPDGTSTATLVDDGTASGNHQIQKNVTSFFVAGTTYALSVYVKDVSRRYFNLGVYFDATNYVGAIFDLTNQTVTTGQSGTGYSVTSANMVSVGSGWFRCTMVFLWNSTQGSICLATANGTTVGSYGLASYTGSNKQLYIWGAQLERVTYQTQPRAYIPTTTAAVYQPRYDYDPSVVPAQPRGMLIEESRSNIQPYSQQFDGGSWTRNNILAFGSGSIANAVTAPDGTTTGYKITPDTTGAVAHSIYYNSVTLAAVTYAFSIYAKPAGYNWIKLGNLSTGGGVNFNLSTGAVGAASSGYSGSITYVGNGWYRCVVIWTATAGSITPGFYIATADNNVVFAGDGTSGVYAWGMQIEAGSFATSYIPTVASSVTRVADVVKWTSAAFSSYWNASAGSFIAQAGVMSVTTYNALCVARNTATTLADRIDLSTNFNSATVASRATVTSGGVTQSDTFVTVPAMTANTNYRFGCAFAANNFVSASVGNIGTPDTSGSIPSGTNTVEIGNRNSGGILNGWVQSFAYYNQRLPNAILRQKSAVNAPY